jgi:hypothetical protein
MKKWWAVFILLIGVSQAYADEGMWVIQELNNRIWRDERVGINPSYEQLYSDTNPSLTNSVVILEGVVRELRYRTKSCVTKSSVRFRFYSQLSSVEHDYLKDGFVSQSKADELPVPVVGTLFA